MATLMTIPIELKSLVISFCDFPTIITLLQVNKHLNSLALPIASNHDLRIQFLLEYESSEPNRIHELPTGARQTIPWHENHQSLWRSKHLYICFQCEKLLRPIKFAGGQCYRMMLSSDYSSERKRFCIECGIRTKKYCAGSMIQNTRRDYRVLLCGGCGKWTPDFYCMREKRCFRCTERTLVDAEKFVEGFEAGEGTPAEDQRWFATSSKQKVKNAGLKGNRKIERVMNYPVRPPCCRSCGDHWRYTPTAFRYGLELMSGGSMEGFHHGYVISGKPRREMGQVPCRDQLMEWFCPYPLKNPWRT